MDESREFAMSQLNASLRGRVDVAREKMEDAKRRMEDYCRELGEEVVMERTRVIRERYPWYQNFLESCFGHGRRSLDVEPPYLGDGYEGEVSRLTRGARIIARGMEMLNAEFFGQQQDRRRLALERDLNSRLRNPLWRTRGADPNADDVPPLLRRISTPSTSRATPSTSSAVVATPNRADDGVSRLVPSPEVSFRILRDFVHEDAVDEELDDPFRSPIRRNQRPHTPPPAVDFPDFDDEESIGHGVIPEDAPDSSDDNVSDDGQVDNADDDNVAPAVPLSPPAVVPAPAVPAPAVPLVAPVAVPALPVVAAVVAAAPALPALPPVVAAVAAPPAIAAAPLAPVVPIRRRKRVWNVGIATKNEPPRKKVTVEGEEADFGSVGALGEEAEALHEMLRGLDLENLHLEVDTKLSRVRGSVKRWGRQMSATLMKKNVNAINFCRIAMGVKD